MMDEKRTKHQLRVRRRTVVISILAAMILMVMGVFAGCGSIYPSEGSAEEQLRSQLADGKVQEVTVNGTLYLHGPVEINGTKTLKGNGVLKAVGTWSGTEQDYVLVLGKGADITLDESITIDGNAVSGGVYVSEGAELTVAGQAVVKNAAEALSNVMAAGSVKLEGGELKNANGHNLYVSGDAVLSGGVVKNSGTEYAGVYNAGKLEMTGGEITGAYDNVYVAEGASFLWTGGKNLNAVNNGVTVAEGGYLNTTSLAAFMEGAGKQGIHLYGEANVDDVFLVGSGENNIKIEESGVMTMVNGAIDSSLGHGITNRGTLTMLGGEITNSKACGILTTGKLEVTSGSIFGNGNQGILVRNGGHAVIKGSTLSISSNNMGISVEEHAYAEVTECNVNTNSIYNFSSAGELYLHDLTTGGSGSNCIATNYGGHILAENITINGTSRNNGIYNVNGSLVELKNVTIDKAKTNGIRNLDAHLVAENLTITNCGREGLSIGDYIYQGAGSVKINGLTTSGMAGSNMAVDMNCTGTIEITNGKLGMAGTNNLKIQGGNVTLTDVELLGNKPGGNSTHGILMDQGAKVTATNLLICDTVASGIRNRGGEFVGEHVVMRNLGYDGISNVPHGTTQHPGTVTIHDFYITGAANINVLSDCPGGAVYLTDSTLGKCNTNSVRVIRGKVYLNNVLVQGHTENPKEGNQHGIFISNGEVIAKNITVENTDAAALRVGGGIATVTASVFQNTGSSGVFQSGGTAILNGVTITNNKGDAIGVTDGTLKGTSVTATGVPGNGINQSGGSIDLGEVNLTGTGTNNGGLKSTGGNFEADILNIQNFRDGIVTADVYDDDGKLTSAHGGSITVTTGGTFSQIKRNGLGIGGDVTVKLTGVTMEKPATAGVNMWNADAEVTLTDVTIDGAKDGAFVTNGSLTVNNSKIINNTQDGVEMNGGNVTINGITIDKARDALIANNGSLTVNGATVMGVWRNGMTVNGAPTVNLTDVTFTSPKKIGIAQWGAGNVTLNNVQISGSGEQGVILQKGTITLNSGVITGSKKTGIQNDGGTVILNGGYVYGNAGGDVNNNKGSLTIGKVTVGYDAGGTSTGGKITSSNMIYFSGDAVSDIHASGKKIELNINGNANNTQLVQFESNEIALSLMDNFNASGKPLGVDDKILFIDIAIAEVDGKQYSSLDKAIEAAHKTGSSGIVTLLENITVGKTYTISGNVTITGAKTITRGAVMLFDVTGSGSLTLKDLTISGTGYAADKSAFTVAGGLTMENVVLKDMNAGAWAGGALIYLNKGPAATFTNVTVSGGSGQAFIIKGAASDGKAQTFTNCTFENRTASAAGTVFNGEKGGKVEISNCTFSNNSSTGHGGAIYIDQSEYTIKNCTFTNNKSTGGHGGAITVGKKAASKLIVENSTFTGNNTTENKNKGMGGAIWIRDNGVAQITGSSFAKNISATTGGAIMAEAKTNVTIKGGSFQNNTAGSNADKNGGAIYATSADVSIDGTSFTGNKGKWGGTIYVTNAALNVTGASFTGNDANGTQGGAIFAENSSNVTVTGSTFSGNAANEGKDIYLKHAEANLTVSGATKAEEIWLREADTVKVTGTLADGSSLVLHWNAIPTGAAIEFDSADAANENYDNVNLSEALRKNYHLKYEGNCAYIVAGEDKSVAKVGNIGYATLADAVAAAQSGTNKTVVLQADIVLDEPIAITGDVIITDNGTARTITHGDYMGEMFNVSGSLTLQGTSANSLTVASTGSMFSGGSAVKANAGAQVTVSNAKFTKHDASANGSAISAVGTEAEPVTLNVSNTTFDSNESNYGAVCVNYGTAQITGCTFTGNTADGAAGVYIMEHGSATIANTTFANNTADKGGAIVVKSGVEYGCRTTVTNCTFTGNTAEEGGAIYASYKNTTSQKCGLTLDSCSFSGNTASKTPAGSNVHYVAYRINKEDKALTLKGAMSTNVYVEAGDKVEIAVEGTLADGSNITFQFNTVDYPWVVNFDSEAAANANFDNISLAAAHTATHHLKYEGARAIVTKGKAVARIGTTIYTDFASAVAAAQSGEDHTVTLMSDVTMDATISVTGTLTITDDGTARTITRASGFTGTMFNVTGGGSLTFSSTGDADVANGAATGAASKLTIDGNGGNVTGAEPAVLATSSNVTVGQGVRFTNFKNASGKPVLQIHKDGGSLTITGGIFDNNTVTGYCGTIAVWNSNNVSISNAVFKNNICTGNTGSAALYLNCKKTCELENCVFDTNNGYNGGAVNVAGSTTVTFTGCTFKNNINNNRRGSSIYVDKGGSQVTINGCTFESNQGESITVHNSGARIVTVNGTVITTSGAWAAKTDAQLMAYTQAAAAMLDEETQPEETQLEVAQTEQEVQ